MRQRLGIEKKAFQGSAVEVCALSVSELHRRKGCETLWLALDVSHRRNYSQVLCFTHLKL